MSKEVSCIRLSGDELDLLVEKTEGFSGADIDGLIREAAYEASSHYEEESDETSESVITGNLVFNVLDMIKENKRLLMGTN